MEAPCIFLNTRKVVFWFTLLAFAACKPAGNAEQGLAYSAKQIQQAKAWTQRATRELDLALRDSITKRNPELNPQYVNWLDSLRLADILVKTAQDRIETDRVVLDRLISGKPKGEIAKITSEYWESDDRLGKLSGHVVDAFNFILANARDTSLSYIAAEPTFWDALGKQEIEAAQWNALDGASLELDIAYLDWLEGFRQHFGLPPYPTQKLRLVVSPESKKLLAGDEFHARLWFSSATDIPELSYNGDGVSIDSSWSKEAQIHLVAGTDTMTDSRSWYQHYEAEASFFNEAGTEKQYWIRDSFLVNRPAIRFYGQRPIYLNCGHRVQVEAPLLGNALNPSFEVDGGTFESGLDSAWFVLEPTERDMHVSVYQAAPNSSILLDTFFFQCVEPPRPQIVLLVNGKPYQDLTAIPRKSRLVLQVLPDPDFADLMPEDALYGMEAAEVLIQQKPDAPPRSILKFSGRGRSGEQGVPVLLDGSPVPLPPGTLLYIRAEGIFRHNYKDVNIPDLRFNDRERMVSVVLR